MFIRKAALKIGEPQFELSQRLPLSRFQGGLHVRQLALQAPLLFFRGAKLLLQSAYFAVSRLERLHVYRGVFGKRIYVLAFERGNPAIDGVKLLLQRCHLFLQKAQGPLSLPVTPFHIFREVTRREFIHYLKHHLRVHPLVRDGKSNGGLSWMAGPGVDHVDADRGESYVLTHLVQDHFSLGATATVAVKTEAANHLKQARRPHDLLVYLLDALVGETADVGLHVVTRDLLGLYQYRCRRPVLLGRSTGDRGGKSKHRERRDHDGPLAA